ncbi:ABC transporter permease subunit [Ornithinibacillus sp. L9]|uniref:ABC transporter permease subunit n=1 Tax=Ornithinibacillus caprae TaxID=2678566 RepID=A0A6N8FDB2_9BACI|nr:sugar ABC transporter permease [Ornithinibacillus caprae]MUK87375.1 ABC transporter permease subunit [Ornithinibacillus caprae]
MKTTNQKSFKQRFSRSFRQNIFAYTLLLPSFIFLTLFTFYPTIKSIQLSFYSGPMTRLQFSGLDQYKDVFTDEIFRKVLWNNIIFMIGTVPASLFLAMYLAIWLNKRMKGSALLRTSFFYPTVIPLIAVANIWLFIYTPQYGLLDRFLDVFGGSGPNWLGDPNTVMIAMIIMIIWKDAGFFMIFYLAGLQNLPRDVYEAATIEGAKPFQMFRNITFPLLMPTTLFVLIVAITNSFKNVDHLYIMTKGGPDNASNLLLYYIYEVAFTNWDLGKAAVLTVILIVILLSVTAFNYLYLDRKIHY